MPPLLAWTTSVLLTALQPHPLTPLLLSRTVAPLHQRQPPEEDNPSDPDNTPPRSRLFMVVPKSADGPVIEVRRQ